MENPFKRKPHLHWLKSETISSRIGKDYFYPEYPYPECSFIERFLGR